MDTPPLTRKRRRPAFSCSECRSRKVKCDRVKPCCGQCSSLGLSASCTYEENQRVRPSDPASIGAGSPIELASTATHPPKRTRMEGIVSKTRVFGNGHWMNTFSLVKEISNSGLPFIGESYWNFSPVFSDPPSGRLAETIRECKTLARDIKAHRPSRKCLPSGILNSLPERSVIDELVRMYFDTFESCYGIFCHDSFMVEYAASMNSPESTDDPFVLSTLLIATVAGPMCANDDTRRQIAINARGWIDIAQTWLSAPLEKNRLTIQAVQIHCLMLLSRQVNQIGADLVWISAGSLLRMGMQVGLHQDPDLLGEMRFQDRELRRRLWYTILEMNVQAAIDAGMLPMVTEDDYNTKAPGDREPSEGQMHDSGENASNSSTVSFQSLLAKSLPLRFRIAKTINSMREEPTYEQVLDLGNELSSTCSEVARGISQVKLTTSFPGSFCSHLIGRFSLCLHCRYAIRAKINPLYSHAQRVCLDTSLDLVTALDDPLYSQILRQGAGMFRDLITRGAFVIFLELSSNHQTDTSIFAKKRHRARLEPLLQDARRLVQYSRDRVSYGDMNVKTYVCLSMMMAEAEARLHNLAVKEAVETAMQQSLDVCREILQEMASSSGNNPSPEFETAGNDQILTPGFDMNLESDFDGLFDLDLSDFNLPMQWSNSEAPGGVER
ncbi:putative C6 transcription factor [Aspergillus stella-maris]|uniref:putative C6 transcription factor n=1 Tax=Aspergillus stella-maris TaxID=1810926 RepID=UPI003CCDB96B